MRSLLEYSADLSAQDNDRDTPLPLAADQGKFTAAQLLIGCGAVVDSRNKLGQTRLQLCHFLAFELTA
jgi:ankyrin repeat protein